MSDERALLNLQEDVTAKLLSEAALATVNILSRRKMLVQNEADVSVAWMTARGEKIGTGIVVEMPFLDDDRKETGIQESTINVQVLCFEHRETAQSAAGSGLYAEQIALLVRRLLRGMIFEGSVGGLFTEGRSIEAGQMPEDLQDVVFYVVTVKAKLRSPAETRCLPPTISEAALTVTLANQTGGATIYYTTDESFPGSGNADAELYTAPFLVTTGTVVRFAAEKSGLSGSAALRRIIT